MMNVSRWTIGMIAVAIGCFAFGGRVVNAQKNAAKTEQAAALSAQDAALVKISVHTAIGNLEALDVELRAGLEAGLSVNQIKAALEQLYAYCGFPRSLNGITTLMAVVESRKQQGLRDEQGKSHEPITTGDRYERGRATLEKLTRTPQPKPAPGFGEFSPESDRFLKEHLFADVFDNPLLTFRERELVTISALAAMTGVEPQLKAHIGMGRNTGISAKVLVELADLVDSVAGRSRANQVRRLLDQPERPVVEEGMLVRLFEIQIASESRDEYFAILKEEARKSVEAEPGVIAILPIVRQDDPTQVRIVEIYTDHAAYEAHIASPHFQQYKTSTQEMVQSLELIDMKVLDAETMRKMLAKLK